MEEDEIEEMESSVYKIRPFGSTEKGHIAAARARAGQQVADADRLGVNMRDLGPGGRSFLRTISCVS